MPTAPQPVVDSLQACASLHWTAIEHYTTLAEHLARWGYAKLGDRYKDDASEECRHLTEVVKRLEFYGVQPAYQHVPPSWPRYDFPGILTANFSLETAAASAERAGITAARSSGDEATAVILTGLLQGSEESIREIEADRFVISQVGIDNYLASMV